MTKVITERKEIEQLHIKFQTIIDTYFNKEVNCLVGFPGGSFEDNVRYSSESNLWISVQKLDNRYWNGFGINKPTEGKSNSLVGEINFPYEGVNRRVAGVFAKEENGNILVLHRGNIGGGKKGVGKKLFKDNFRGDFITAIDGDKEIEFCLVGELTSKNFFKQIANFIYEIQRIKKIELSADFNSFADFSYTDEHFGISVTERNSPITIERTHGIIVNALAEELKKKNLQVGNDKNRDLFVIKRGQIKILFEVKTNSSTQSLSSAIGQLLIYSIPIKNKVKLVAVLPDRLSKSVSNKFNSLEIEILYYEWKGKTLKFINLDDKL